MTSLELVTSSGYASDPASRSWYDGRCNYLVLVNPVMIYEATAGADLANPFTLLWFKLQTCHMLEHKGGGEVVLVGVCPQ